MRNVREEVDKSTGLMFVSLSKAIAVLDDTAIDMAIENNGVINVLTFSQNEVVLGLHRTTGAGENEA